MTGPWWQGDGRFAAKLGHPNPDGSQATIGRCGCVLCAAAAAANRWAGRSVNPGSANLLLQGVAGAFVDGHGHPGDELDLPVACPALGLECGDAVGGDRAPIDTGLLTQALRAAFSAWQGAFVRIEVGGAEIEHHTILACVDAGAIIECLDSACPRQGGVAEGWATLRWADLWEASELRWGSTTRTYRVCGVRPVRAAKAVT